MNLYQSSGEDSDESTTLVRGTYSEVNGKKYIFYKEYSDDKPKLESSCVIKWENENCVYITKNSAFQSHLVFEQGVRHQCPYGTEMGVVILGVYTKNIEFEKTDQGGVLQIEYDLDVNLKFMISNKLTLTFSKNNEDINFIRSDKNV